MHRVRLKWACLASKTGERDAGSEPIRTLQAYRRRDRKVYFGQNLIPRAFGTIKVGDECVIEERSDS